MPIATIAGCTSCHTPDKAEYQNPKTFTLEQIQTIAFDGQNAVDSEKFLAGGRLFDLGPAGVVYTRNLTPDKTTGIGKWTDEQVKTAIKTSLAELEERHVPQGNEQQQRSTTNSYSHQTQQHNTAER